MRTSWEERFRKRLRKIARKNKFCYVCVFPILAAGLFFAHFISYCRGNVKRFSMLAAAFMFFVVFSSFSFPAFISGNGGDYGLKPVPEEAGDVAFAAEPEIDPEELGLLDGNVFGKGNDYSELYYGMAFDGDSEKSSNIEGLFYGQEGIEQELTETVSGNEGQKAQEPGTRETGAGAPEDTGASVNGGFTFSRNDWRLLLVNPQHSVPEDYEVSLGTIQTIKGTMQCDERIIEDFQAMKKAAKEDGVSLQVCSPYRDEDYQRMLFDRKITNNMNKGMSYVEAYRLASRRVNVPGASEHQLGLALDIVTSNYTYLNWGFADTPAGQWLAEHSYQYGFILRYPEGKEDITGVDYEPWHFRYVGEEAATVITEAGITLEEFWEEYEDKFVD